MRAILLEKGNASGADRLKPQDGGYKLKINTVQGGPQNMHRKFRNNSLQEDGYCH